MQLDSLWNYMQFDLEVDKFKNRMAKSPNRQKLMKNQEILKDQQEAIKKIENDVAVMADRIEAVKDEIARLQNVVAGFAQELSQNPPTELEDMEARKKKINNTLETLHRYEQELSSIKSGAEERNRQQKDIHTKAAKAKFEFEQVKQIYDAEYKEDKLKLMQMRDEAKKKSEAIDPAMLEKYNAIKQHSTPPMALLNGNQCTGCFMELPIGTLREVKSGEKIIECDNCGRILYKKE